MSHPFDADPVYEQLGVPPRHLRLPHALSGLLQHLAQSVERLEAWRDRVYAGLDAFGGLTPEEHAADAVLGREAFQDLLDSATAIDAVVAHDLSLLPVRPKTKTS